MKQEILYIIVISKRKIKYAFNLKKKNKWFIW